MSVRTPWVVAENTATGGYQVHCMRCEAIEVMRTPMLVDAFVLRMRAFAAEHRYCPEPAPTETAPA